MLLTTYISPMISLTELGINQSVVIPSHAYRGFSFLSAPPVHIVNKKDAQVPLEVQEGENVTLTTRLSQEKAPARWLKNMRPIYPGPRVIMSSEGLVRSLALRQAEPSDSGVYSCDIGDDEMHFTMYVRGKMVPPTCPPQYPQAKLPPT